MGAQYFILNKMPFFSKISEYQCFAVCCPKTSFCASKPSKLPCKLVIRQFLFQVSLGMKEVQMGAHDFKINMVLLFARKPGLLVQELYSGQHTSKH